MNLIEPINCYATMFLESEGWGKLAVLIHFLSIPFHHLGLPHTNKFFKKVILNKGGVRISCGKSVSYARTANSFCERIVMDSIVMVEGTFIDIGSHIGKYTLKIADKLRKTGKVLSIEPDKRNFAKLKENIRLNNLKNVIAENVACMDDNTKKDFYLTTDLNKFSGGSTFYLDNPNKSDSKRIKEKVQCFTLDYLVHKHRLKNIKYIKIDVEGAELDVLHGLINILKKQKPIVIVEALDKNQWRLIKSFFKENNYGIATIKGEYYLASPVQ